MAERRPISVDSEEDLAALVALSALPGVSPSRLWELLALGPPVSVWDRARRGMLPSGRRAQDGEAWQRWASTIDAVNLLDAHRSRNIAVLPFGDDHYPELLFEDPDPPAVLYTSGPAPLDGRVAVAIVGTRRSTRYGHDVAYDLGAQLAARGILVVSGLAHGIDAAAHAGASSADPGCCIGVVASGLDRIYPANNRGLWHAVADRGRLISEWPLGSTARPWRFPARNRLVAALSAAVVVVESPARGGSMYTVDEAVRRDRSVFAVPGSINSPASVGTNKLIVEGAQLLASTSELAEALAPAVDQLKLAIGDAAPEAVSTGESESWLLALIGWEPITVDGILATADRSPIDVTLEIERQIAAGAIVRQGVRIERVR